MLYASNTQLLALLAKHTYAHTAQNDRYLIDATVPVQNRNRWASDVDVETTAADRAFGYDNDVDGDSSVFLSHNTSSADAAILDRFSCHSSVIATSRHLSSVDMDMFPEVVISLMIHVEAKF